MLRKTAIIHILFFPLTSYAQSSMWGSGLYGGMQSCPYQTRVGNGATNMDDVTKEIQSEIRTAQKQLKTKKAEQKKLSKVMDKSREDIEEVITEDFSEVVLEHIENNRTCRSYKGYKSSQNQSEDGSSVEGSEGGIAISPQTNGDIVNSIEIRAFTIPEWNALCDENKAGSVAGLVCDGTRFRQADRGRATAQDCRKGLSDYRKSYAQFNKLQREIERLEDSITRSNESLIDAKQEAQDAQRDRMLGKTEGDVCIECMQDGDGYSYQNPQTDWASVIGNVALGLGSVYMGYKTNQMVAESNANNGWPTNPYASVGYGYGLGAMGTGVSQALGGGSGIYGSISGGIGSGGFGCAGMNGGSMGMMGPYGGMNGNGMWGNPYGMAGMGSTNGGIFNSGMGPWGMNGMYGGMNGMVGMGNGSMMGGNMGSMTSYDPTALQYQQQMMQMQMQQYQNLMQYQQQYQQQAMQKYQAVSSLQQEMYSLMARIQQIQYGYGTSGYIGNTGTFGTTGYYSTYPSSAVITPLPGNTSTSTITTIPTSR